MRAITAIIISLTLCACTKTKETVEPIITKEPITIIDIEIFRFAFLPDEWESSSVATDSQQNPQNPTLGTATAYTTITYQNSSNNLIIEDVVNNTITTKILKNKSNGNLQSQFNSLLSKASKDPVICALKGLVKEFDKLNVGKQPSATGFVLHIITIGDEQYRLQKYLYGYLTTTSVTQNVVDRGYSNSTEAKAAFEAYKKLQSSTQALSSPTQV